MNLPKDIDWFKGPYFFLSNFFESVVDGYGSNEARYQSKKTKNMKARQIFKKLSAAESKVMGQALSLRTDWEEVKDDEMMEGLLLKFEAGTFLASQLVSTGDSKLIEGNYWHDNYWGDCFCKKCKDIEGQNKLGRMLMQIREKLRES
jgi:ribA/ribD-fused uncharacterized protein